MSAHDIINADFIRQCIAKEKQNIATERINLQPPEHAPNSLSENGSWTTSLDNSLHDYNDDDSLLTPSLSDHISLDSDSEPDSVDHDDETITACTGTSVASSKCGNSITSMASEELSTTNNTPSKSFLQLKGISIGNFNMNCNFDIESALCIMMRNELSILAIQEHTPWNKELSTIQITSLNRHCEAWGYFATISKLQILIIDKQLLACHRETMIFEDGRIIKCRFEIANKQFVTFVPVYGVPHSSHSAERGLTKETDENNKLQTMTQVQNSLNTIISKAVDTSDFLYVFGDLQDTPDNSKLFHYGSCRIAKHPLGIVKTCEAHGLICSIFTHINTLEHPIVSRHGTKGGRFIDGMYTTHPSLANILGISIISDSGIVSDHDLIISKIDLGIEQYKINTEKEERIDFKTIMKIPVIIKQQDTHPVLNDQVFKGIDFEIQSELYTKLQETIHDPNLRFLDSISDIGKEFLAFQSEIILQTKSTITPDEQINGKLIPRTQADADRFNNLSKK